MYVLCAKNKKKSKSLHIHISVFFFLRFARLDWLLLPRVTARYPFRSTGLLRIRSLLLLLARGLKLLPLFVWVCLYVCAWDMDSVYLARSVVARWVALVVACSARLRVPGWHMSASVV